MAIIYMPRKVDFKVVSELRLKGIVGFMRRQVTAYGTGAKVTCPKEFLGKTAYVIIVDEPWAPHEGAGTGRRGR